MDFFLEKKLFTCYLIGEDHLLLECAEILLSHHHSILGIISPLASAEDFSLARKIPYFRKLADAMPVLSITSFDYLFSVINGSILPLSLLKRAKCMAINYHNAPLPKYAGLHAPSWAILHSETVHGVTWHQMVEEIDAGDILKQALIEIESNETGLSLGVKCYKEAINTFKELVYDLSFQCVRSTPQDLAHRTYFDYYKKPRHGGWINWNDAGESIDRVCRALSLGHHYNNRLGLPKFNIGKHFFLITQLHMLDEHSTNPPGTLLEVSSNYWKIATRTKIIQLEQVIALDGSSSNLADIAKALHLKKGTILPSELEKVLLEYEYLYEIYSIHELFWVRQKKHFNPAFLPFQTLSANLPNHSLECIASLDASSLFSFPTNEYPNNPCNLLFGALLIYLYRLGNKEKLGVGFSHSKLQQLSEPLIPLFAQVVPFSIEFEEDYTVEKALNKFFNQILKLDKHLSFSKDIFYRYPDLSSSPSFYPIAVLIGHEQGLATQIETIPAAVIITISNTYKVQWYSHEKNDNLKAVIQNSIQHLSVLINAMFKQPATPISKLPLLTEKELKQLLINWNDTQTPYGKNKNVIEVFLEQVQKTPSQLALAYEKQSLTYQALNERSNQFARLLQKQGVQPGAHVAICTDQEIHLIVGLLAILKSGAAYIPIDTNYPSSHIQFILSDSNATLALSSNSVKDKMQVCCDNQNVPLLVFDNLTKEAAHENSDNLNFTQVEPNHLAYIIYTSGTTGKPKGVMIPHRGINRLVKTTNYIQITPNDRIAQAASISFDAATFEIWGALLNGATLVAVPHEILLNVSHFARFLAKKEITILWLTSALFNQYASINPSMFSTLSYLLVGGDVLNTEQIMKVVRCAKGAPQSVLNGYGPTENTTFTTTYPIEAKKEAYQSIPIGKPIANTTVYILDTHLQPTPIGAPGELYTGGAGVALGYLNRPEITASRFIPNPFDETNQTLLYKTGDMVRWLPDGNIDYLSRQDNQVKIRGFRVELEAINSILSHYEAIDQCAVRVYENEKHQKFIIAYIVLKFETPIANIQQYMATQLPAYMIPSFFITIDTIPLTLNGKVNFEKLPAPDFSMHALRAEYVAPHTPIEKEIERIWCELFGLDQVGIHDSFFDLGGHSLMVTQMVLKMKDQLHYDLPLQQFLEKPTIAYLAQLIEANIHSETEQSSFMAHWQFDTELSLPSYPRELQLYKDKPQSVLLTGATGFLGANLLYQLHTLTAAEIYCLVRANDSEEAIKKLDNALQQYPELVGSKRIHLLVGDLEKSYLGLAIEEFMMLSEKIDIIYHNGAAVHHLYSYDMLRAANVLSVKEILKLATIKKQIPVHYVSTLSAAGNYTNPLNTIIEDFIYTHPNPPPADGYSQTKLVAEELLAKAHQQQLPVKIYRPGWILGDSISGFIAAEQNHLLMLVKGCLQLGYAPAWDISLDILPVNVVSQMIVKSSLNQNIPYHVFNLANPNKLLWKELMAYLLNRGYELSLLPPNEWRAKLSKEIDSQNTLYSLLTLYINQNDNDWMKALNKISHANNQNTHYAFRENNMEFPLVNSQLLDIYFSFLEQKGFLMKK
ncbi:amino acid adenylation domain-containing protein/thioester reductase domain-containing protein [Legionella jamestowniensis DSM 19215]|uniref:Peptide synthetase, non-ribosomal n=1 Tax=Legionella jamestowniensis TaxID=455 RepID=A0A0W0UUI1_9GAMM|nr:peptide synthetase, non-ribosomal [Legionella jamestowniensis]SFL70157.1 amino acid adenylation domain-containing protein/thioester reductase domain-containing protein [Legionella jamestowniensis DSM 19215]